MTKLFFLLIPALLFSWEEFKKMDDITLYEKHDESSKFVQFKAITYMPYSLKQVTSTIMDYKTYPFWLSDCIASDKNNSNIYILMQPPWPLNQRQVWAELHQTSYKYKEIITLKSIENYKSNYEGVWFNYLHSEFILEEISPLKTKVTLSLLGDPGGYPPSWMVNLMAWKIPYQSLHNLRGYLRTR